MDFNILTFHRAYNYGAVLQAFALQEFVTELGYSCGVYDYASPSENKPAGLKGKILQALQLFSARDRQVREAKYRQFVEESLHLNLEEDSKVYISGSDQVWNPGIQDETYFLRFAPEESRRISYAASMGESHMTQEQEENFRTWLKEFDGVSVREEQDKERLASLCDKNIQVHVDPTLLHDKAFWRKHARPVEGLPDEYILVYLMHRSGNVNKLLKWLKKETGAKIVVIDGQGVVQGVMTNLVYHDIAKHRVGPREFLWLFDHAKYVVTSSFHGTAFSLIFEKELYAITNLNRKTRITNILEKVGLSPVGEDAEVFERRDGADWEKVRSELKTHRTNSQQYIKNAYPVNTQE